ncbi:MAG: DUF4064 domain-containing protein [bacterium]
MRTRKATFVCGLIGGILGILAYSCVAVCAGLLGSASNELANSGVDVELGITTAYLYIFGIGGLIASIVGLVSACLSSNDKKWCIIMLVCGAVNVVTLFFLGFGLFTAASAVLFIVGGALGLGKPDAGQATA